MRYFKNADTGTILTEKELDAMHLREWADENLLTKQEAIAITGQGLSAFDQSINTNKLTAFYDHGKARSRVRLYLKSDVETYAKGIFERRKRLSK